MKFKYLFFLLEKTNDFFLVWRMYRLQKKFDRQYFDKKKYVKFYMVKGISLGKGFWVVNTWTASVRK